MSPETLGTLGPIVVMVAIFYFLLYRPQKKQQSRRRAMLDSLKKGDQVITIGGIYGTIEEIGDKSLKLYTLYGPPDHKDGVVHKTKADAEASEEHFDGTTTE